MPKSSKAELYFRLVKMAKDNTFQIGRSYLQRLVCSNHFSDKKILMFQSSAYTTVFFFFFLVLGIIDHRVLHLSTWPLEPHPTAHIQPFLISCHPQPLLSHLLLHLFNIQKVIFKMSQAQHLAHNRVYQ
jgi:hypothetical protein